MYFFIVSAFAEGKNSICLLQSWVIRLPAYVYYFKVKNIRLADDGERRNIVDSTYNSDS